MRILLAFALFIASLGAATPDLAKLDAYIEKSRAEWDVPGMSIAIVKDGKMAFSKGYGVRAMGKSEKVDADTLFAIASNSKAFTAAALAGLVDQGKLKWDQRVIDVLPWFQLYDPWVSNEIRLEDLLCHRSGLKTFSGDLLWHNTQYDRREIVRRLRYLKPVFPFRDGYGYSNVMFLTAGVMLEQVTGKTWEDYVRENFLAPLGMKRTITTVRGLDKQGNYAMPHSTFNGPMEMFEWVNWDTMGPAGGIISSANDMSRWLMLQLNAGELDGKRYFSKEQQTRMWRPHNVQGGPSNGDKVADTHFRTYGLGWGVSDFQGRFTVSHGGGYDGMVSRVWLMPEEKLGIVVLTNTDKEIMGALVDHIRDAYLGLPEKDDCKEALARVRKRTRPEPQAPASPRPAREPKAYAGTYRDLSFGDVTVTDEGGKLVLRMLPDKDLVGDLTPFDADTFKLAWRKKFPYYAGGVAQFVPDTHGAVTALRLDIPNNDFWFDELDLKRQP
jgi:CubicO group peptidase (beta-lactamase class C family)